LDGSLERSAIFLDLARRLADEVKPERRPAFDLLLAEVSLGLARWRGDLATGVETRPLVDAALAAQPPDEGTLSEEIRAVALLNLGIAELWSSRLVDAGRVLEQALALARRAGRPWLEIAGPGHLAIAGPLTGSSLCAGPELSEKAVKVADEHGCSEDPIMVCGLAVGAMALLWLGRLGEAERWLERAERTLQLDGEPGTEPIVHQARGLLCLSPGRLEDSLAALRPEGAMQAILAGTHVFSAAGQARLLRTQAYMGRLPAARGALAEISEAERDGGDIRLATAVLDPAEGEADQFVSTNTIRDPFAPHLRQARRPRSRRGCGPRPWTRHPRPVAFGRLDAERDAGVSDLFTRRPGRAKLRRH
jgi:LuxR family transcriptional regulator, maltose regulon positive regulatory protein